MNSNWLTDASPGSPELRREPIAIIGIGCRYAGADSVQEFWRLIRDGRESVAGYPGNRFPEIDAAYVSMDGIASVRGGFLPAGGVNVRLRIGIGKNKLTYGVREHVSHARFTSTYTFGVGSARIHRRYWFQVATLPSGNYPYAPSSSNHVYVKVGGHPTARHRHKHRHHHRH